MTLSNAERQKRFQEKRAAAAKLVKSAEEHARRLIAADREQLEAFEAGARRLLMNDVDVTAAEIERLRWTIGKWEKMLAELNSSGQTE